MSSNFPYEIRSYSIDNLIEIFLENPFSNRAFVKSKNHIKYFQEYFDKLDAHTIIIEKEYIDKDYLEDYAAYYVRCFNDYGKKCKRLHFFKSEISNDDFEEILILNHEEAIVQRIIKEYLGFIILKPIPETTIGRTCLKTYKEEDGRSYPIKRMYNVNLFGISLVVNTLALQEQDKVASACATSALWSVFQSTGMLFQHPIPSPVEITSSATKKYLTIYRALPNQGLCIEQMVQAIINVGLVSYNVNVKMNEFLLTSYVYAYLKANIPIIFVIEIIQNLKIGDLKKLKCGDYKGKHAIAITGFRTNEAKTVKVGDYFFKSRAASISKLFVHDDQVGPFARMEFDGIKIKINGHNQNIYDSLSISWQNKDGEYGSKRAIPHTLLIPLYKKIRLPLAVIQDATIRFNAAIESFLYDDFLPTNETLEWEIYLITVEKLKEEIYNSQLNNVLKKELLLKTMPKFIWRSAAYNNNNEKIFDLLFDATDIEQGQFFLGVISWEIMYWMFFHGISQEEIIEKKYQNLPEWKIFEWFKKNPPLL